MGTKLSVGNLARGATSDDLRELFAQFGEVLSAGVAVDRDAGFVVFGSDDEAQAAIAGMNGKAIDGRSLTVGEAGVE